MTNAKLKSAVTKASKAVDVDTLALALGKLVEARRKKVVFAPQSVEPSPKAGTPMQSVPMPRQARRHSGRRTGRNQHYRATNKVDVSRYGTFRHYLISTVRAHEYTWDAERAHAACENPKFAKNKLDIAWCANEGYIEFI